MPSERSKLDSNINNSKNTRMNIVKSLQDMDFRKDELMHIGRYLKACQTAIALSKQLNRPIKILDLGCGEAYSMRTLYKSFVVKKSEVVKRYIGIDIDEPMLGKTRDEYSKVLESVHGRLIAQDLTVNPHIKVKDGAIDLIIWFEMVEHIQPEFVKPILEEVFRVLSPEGILLLSTPNSNGSNQKLPKDHVYEWSYEDLSQEIQEAGFTILSSHGTSINPSKIPSNIWEKRRKIVEAVYATFGENTAFSCVALAPLFPVEYSKNMLFELKKGEG